MSSQTEYTPKLYNLAKTQDATIANTNAAIGGNEVTRTPNTTPNARRLRCKLAEPVKLVFVIDNSFNLPQSHEGSEREAAQTLLPVQVKIPVTSEVATRPDGCWKENSQLPSIFLHII